MAMTHRFTRTAVGALFFFSGASGQILAAQPTDDCAVRQPSIKEPGASVTDTRAPDRTDLTLTQRLATCGSVLDPPAVGDPDIIEPAPRVGDPMNIHPSAPGEIRPQVK
jgi:hypothetical protein